MLSLTSWSIKLLRFENWNFPKVKKIAKCKHHLLHVFPAEVANFGKAMYRSLERSTMVFFPTVPRLHFLGRALIWPCHFGEHILGLFGLHPSSLSKSAGFVFLSGKASLVSISAAILLLRSWHVYFLLEFEFRGKSCVE